MVDTEPPAETQQYDEPLATLAAILSRTLLWQREQTQVLDEFRPVLAAALAARPSADTETLRARIEKLADELAGEVEVSPWSRRGRRLRKLHDDLRAALAGER